ncbi:hypothetical protein PybrP1_000463 [[Pythium] brassicae (nom. inval.)]|nr:hypothetical protein PybrP1_000463 [[Pythium] brassicae (nom. inval.)]
MKPCSTFALLSVALAASSTLAANCDFGAIQGKLYENATAGLRKCATETGVDIWAITKFPTEKQAKSIMTSRTCVDFLNQINERANREIQCDIQIGDTVKGFGSLITDVLTGQTGNQTETETIKVPEEPKGNAQVKASSLDGDDSAGKPKKAALTPKAASPTPTPSPSSGATSVSLASASVVVAVAVALQW